METPNKAKYYDREELNVEPIREIAQEVLSEVSRVIVGYGDILQQLFIALLVNTVTPIKRGLFLPLSAFHVSLSISNPPDVWNVSMKTLCFAAASEALLTVFGISKSLRSRKTFLLFFRM